MLLIACDYNRLRQVAQTNIDCGGTDHADQTVLTRLVPDEGLDAAQRGQAECGVVFDERLLEHLRDRLQREGRVMRSDACLRARSALL